MFGNFSPSKASYPMQAWIIRAYRQRTGSFSGVIKILQNGRRITNYNNCANKQVVTVRKCFPPFTHPLKKSL